MDLSEFCAARLDEDEAAAKAAADGNDGRWVLQGHPSESAIIWDGNGSPVVYDEGSPTEAEAIHIARHDPARVLREVEAGRKILRLLEHLREFAPYYADMIEGIICDRAAVWSDHPDYDPAWATT